MYFIFLLIIYIKYSFAFNEIWESLNNWIPEITASGGGNNEFQQYFLDPDTSRLFNNILQIHPRFIEDDLIKNLDLYSKGCFNNWYNGCFLWVL